MAIYKTSELFNKLCEIISDGYDYVEINEDYGYNPPELTFNACEDSNYSADYEEICACDLPDGYNASTASHICNLNDFCCDLPFTYSEIFTIKHAIDNALEYFKECLEDKTLSREIKQEIDLSAVRCRNLQAKIAKFVSKLKTH